MPILRLFCKPYIVHDNLACPASVKCYTDFLNRCESKNVIINTTNAGMALLHRCSIAPYKNRADKSAHKIMPPGLPSLRKHTGPSVTFFAHRNNFPDTIFILCTSFFIFLPYQPDTNRASTANFISFSPSGNTLISIWCFLEEGDV